MKTITKKEKKAWYLHCTYIDNYGMEHKLRYKMPRDFQKNVAVVPNEPEFGEPTQLIYENE